MSLSQLTLRQDLLKDYHDYLPELSPQEWRRIRGEQEIIRSSNRNKLFSRCRFCWLKAPSASGY